MAAANKIAKTKKKAAAVEVSKPSNPMNNPLDDLLVPLGPAKKQKLNSGASTSSSKADAAPFQKEAEKHRDKVQAKRSNTEINKIESKPNLMLKSPADKNTHRDSSEDPPPRKKPTANGPLIKTGLKSKSSQLVTAHQVPRAHSNSPTPPPIAQSRESSSPSPIPDYAKSLVPSCPAIAAQTQPVPSRIPPVNKLAPDLSGSETLNIWSIVYPMLKWNPSWLKEALKATEPPPVLDRANVTLEQLKPCYDYFMEYHDIMHSPILFEMWESVLRDYRESEQQRNSNKKIFDQRLAMSSLEVVADDQRLWKLHCEYLCEDSPFATLPQEGDFVQVLVPTLQHHQATHPSFAWVDTVEKVRIRPEMHVNPLLTNMYGKSVWGGGKRTALNIKIGIIIHKYHDTSPDVYKPLPCRVVSSLISSIRQYAGLVVSPRSVLLPHILKPHDPEVFQPSLPASPFKTSASDSSYNPSQTRAIQASVNVMFQSTSAAKILLLQGPPGTGKSHTVRVWSALLCFLW